MSRILNQKFLQTECDHDQHIRTSRPFRCEFEPMTPILEQTELENRRYRQEQAEWRESYQAKLNKEIARIDRELGVDHGR